MASVFDTLAFADTREALRETVAQCALAQVGKPYRREARPLDVPSVFNCALLAWHAYRTVDIELPQCSLYQAYYGEVVSRADDDILPADLLFFSSLWPQADAVFPEGIGHVAIATGERTVVHATSVRGSPFRMRGVQTAPLRLMLARPDLVVVKRLLV